MSKIQFLGSAKPWHPLPQPKEWCLRQLKKMGQQRDQDISPRGTRDTNCFSCCLSTKLREGLHLSCPPDPQIIGTNSIPAICHTDKSGPSGSQGKGNLTWFDLISTKMEVVLKQRTLHQNHLQKATEPMQHLLVGLLCCSFEEKAVQTCSNMRLYKG